jgi:signal transduction histidine kinase
VALIWQPVDCLPTFLTDYEKVQVILRNLISNALKFTERGSVTVSAKVADGGERRAPGSGPGSELKDHVSLDFIEFKVSDTGLGIPEENLPTIFDLFKQVDSSTTRAHEGVGLGLYIAKKYCELLGGEVSVESKLGEGSIFTVRIPYAVAPSMRREYEAWHNTTRVFTSNKVLGFGGK